MRALKFGLTHAGQPIAKFDDLDGARCSISSGVERRGEQGRKFLTDAKPVLYLGVDGARMKLGRERAGELAQRLAAYAAFGDISDESVNALSRLKVTT